MSLSAGITVGSDIQDAFNSNRNSGEYRWFKISLDGEALKLTGQRESSDIATDFDAIHDAVEDKEAAYFVFRLDSKNQQDTFQHVIVWYVPETTKVKTKMLMSSTLESLRQGLGSAHFLGDYRATIKSELKYKDFKNWTPKSEVHKFHEQVRTEKERQLQGDANLEYMDVKPSANKGLSFPLDSEAQSKLQQLQSKQIAFVSIKIDNETFKVDAADASIDADSVAAKLPSNSPRFVFYMYSHDFEGASLSPIVFIYSCPSPSKVKERMIYSATKQAILSHTAALGLTPEKSLELSDPSDLNEKFLFDYIHPASTTAKVSFSKPTRPGKSGKKLSASAALSNLKDQ